MPISLRRILLALAVPAVAWCAAPGACGPAPEIRAEIEKAAAIPIADPFAFDRNVAPFLALRQRYPDNLFVHERYQDAVHEHGVEGHLKQLTEEYRKLYFEHPGELMYQYLNARTLVGRTTVSTIQAMTEIVSEHPDFAPAHRTLAEIYASDRFQDSAKEKAERKKFLALCPGGKLAHRPGPLPNLSPLLDEAERLLDQGGDPERIIAMTIQGLTDDEWRLQRIRPFDWYTIDYKRQNVFEMRAKYWKAWTIQVRCYRQAGQPEKATGLLGIMSLRAAPLRYRDGNEYWNAMTTLVRLYAEGHETAPANANLDRMSQFLAEHPDRKRAAELKKLRKLTARLAM